MTDTIFCYSRPFFALLPPMDPENQNVQKNGRNAWRYYHFTNINNSHMIMVPQTWSVILDHFMPFTPLTTQKIKIWKNGKKTQRYYHFTNVYHKWQSFMFGSWHMECDGQNFLSFWTIFCTFTPITTQQIKILKKWKKCLDILSFYTCVT